MYIGSEGPLDATWAIVAEKPGPDEFEKGRLLIGASGKQLDRHLENIGTHRSKVYLTNTVKNGEIKIIDGKKTVSTPTADDIRAELPGLYRELASMPNLRVITALGDVALRALTNFHIAGISEWRGSVIPSFIGTKIVPTYHPAYYMRGQKQYGPFVLQPVVEHDLYRAFEESGQVRIRSTERFFYTAPASLTEALELLREFRGAKEISFDIETFRANPHFIRSIAFASNTREGVCIPITVGRGHSFWSVENEVAIWNAIAEVLGQKDTCYVTQNGLFDCWHLWRHGVSVPAIGSGFDTMYAHRNLAPDLPHDLAFLVSIYTDPVEPYYKDESGTTDAGVPDEQLWIYNCKDACCTLEVAHGLMEDMKQAGIYDYFKTYIQTQLPLFLQMRQIGFKVDRNKLAITRAQLLSEQVKLEQQFEQEIGFKVNTKSFIDMGRLFDHLGVTYDKTKTGRPKSDEDSILKYADNYPDARDVLLRTLDITEKRTFVSGFLGMQLDSNDFYHAGYDVDKARTGRAASFGADEGGPQLQNIPKPLRSMFIPDSPNHRLTNADLKQAEVMIVAWDAQDPLLMRAFLEGKDVHRVRACIMYRNWRSVELPPDDLLESIKVVCDDCKHKGEKECSHSERYLAKRTGHAFAYRMGPRKLVKILRKENIFITEAEAKRIRSLVVSRAISLWQDRALSELKESRWQTNALGRKRDFFGLLDDELLRNALSNKAQSLVGDIIKRAQLQIYHQFPDPTKVRITTQTHDSLTINHLTELYPQIETALVNACNVPVEFHGRILTIPLDITTGPNWGEQRKWERG